MNIVVDAANMPQMHAGTKYNQGSAYRSSTKVVLKDIEAITFTCQKCEIIDSEKNPSEEPNSTNYGMP